MRENIFDYLMGDMYSNCVIKINGDITSNIANNICDHLRHIRYNITSKALDSDKVFIVISSNGGSVNGSNSIIHEIERLKSIVDVYTVIVASSASSACLISIHGSTGCRYITQDSDMVLHQISVKSSMFNTTIKLIELKDAYDKMTKKWETHRKYMGSQFNIPNDILMKIDLGLDIQLSSNEALDYGLVDYIID